jgi:hypothetical protein
MGGRDIQSDQYPCKYFDLIFRQKVARDNFTSGSVFTCSKDNSYVAWDDKHNMQDRTMHFFRRKYGWDVLKTYCVHIFNYFLARKLRIANVHYVVCSHCRSDNKNKVPLRFGDTMDVRQE